MSNFEDDRLTEALQDTKEAYLIALAMRFISYRIPNAQDPHAGADEVGPRSDPFAETFLPRELFLEPGTAILAAQIPLAGCGKTLSSEGVV